MQQDGLHDEISSVHLLLQAMESAKREQTERKHFQERLTDLMRQLDESQKRTKEAIDEQKKMGKKLQESQENMKKLRHELDFTKMDHNLKLQKLKQEQKSREEKLHKNHENELKQMALPKGRVNCMQFIEKKMKAKEIDCADLEEIIKRFHRQKEQNAIKPKKKPKVSKSHAQETVNMTSPQIKRIQEPQTGKLPEEKKRDEDMQKSKEVVRQKKGDASRETVVRSSQTFPTSTSEQSYPNYFPDSGVHIQNLLSSSSMSSPVPGQQNHYIHPPSDSSSLWIPNFQTPAFPSTALDQPRLIQTSRFPDPPPVNSSSAPMNRNSRSMRGRYNVRKLRSQSLGRQRGERRRNVQMTGVIKEVRGYIQADLDPPEGPTDTLSISPYEMLQHKFQVNDRVSFEWNPTKARWANRVKHLRDSPNIRQSRR